MGSSHKQANSRPKAFTLVELLVVIVIISVLAALLFPLFRSSKEASKQTGCLSNFHQLSLGENLYREERDDTFVPRVAQIEGKDIQYDKLLEPYVKSPNSWSCGEARQSDPQKTKSIGMNRALATAYDGSNPKPKPVLGSEIADSTSTILLSEDVATLPNHLPPLFARNELTPNVRQACTSVLQESAGRITNDYAVAFHRHRDGGTYAFVDGSTKRLNSAPTLTPKVRWFAQNPDFEGTTGSVTVNSTACSKLGAATPISGADPATGN